MNLLQVKTLMVRIMRLNKILTFLFLVSCYKIVPAETSGFPDGYYDTVALVLLLVIVLIFAGFIFYGTGEGKHKPAVKRKSIFQLSFVNKYITGSTPIEKEGEILLQDDYDGIKELDNRVPPWFNYLFYGSILFAAYYMLDYHVLKTSSLQEAEYAEEMAVASQLKEELAKSGTFITEETVTLAEDPALIEKGRQIFNANCVACHAADGGGLIGPNLTDNYWIHGGGIKDIFKIIKYGVPAKGMISWQTILDPAQMQNVSSFIISLKGTKSANPKAPEGIPYNEDAASEPVAEK